MRISRNQLWMGIAELAAKRSTCYRGNVGCLIVHDNRPVGLGYNGPPSSEEHCQGNDCPTRTDGGCLRSVHAEVNALNRVTISATNMDMFVTSSPCPKCAAIIIDNGNISRVYYQSPYRIKLGIEELVNEGIEVYRFSPSGYLVEELTGQVLEAN